jgi:hypothetical protein
MFYVLSFVCAKERTKEKHTGNDIIFVYGKAKKNTDKKAPTQASNTFHNIMKASVKDNPKPNKKKDK